MLNAQAHRHYRRCVLASALCIALGIADASASTITVTNCTDHDPGSLRAAVASAMEGDTVDTSTLTCGAITLSTAEIVINRNALTIRSFANGGTTVSGNGNYRVFNHKGSGTLELENLTITNGKYRSGSGNGGCIVSAGSVTLDASTVSNCIVNATDGSAAGGGIAAQATITLNSSTISNNVAESADGQGSNSYGGGLFARAVVVNSSTLHGNRTKNQSGEGPSPAQHDQGGAIFTYGGNSTVSYSTIDNNYSYTDGGAIYVVGGQLTINNSTISNNVSPFGTGAISAASSHATTLSLSNSTVAFNRSFNFGIRSGGPLSLQSSIISDNVNSEGDTADLDCFQCTLSGSNNAIGTFYNVSNGSAAQIQGLFTVTVDPKLAPLGNHGGLTLTRALLPGSPSIARGNDVGGFLHDQRGTGFSRKTGVGLAPWTDIGAYQSQLVDDEVFSNGFELRPTPFNVWVNTLVTSYLRYPRGVTVDTKGDIFIADTGNNAIREIPAGGEYTDLQLVGSGATNLSNPFDVAVDADGNLFVSDSGNNVVKEIMAAGGYTTARTIGSGFHGPDGIVVDTATGNVFLIDNGTSVKEIVAAGGYTTVRTLSSAIGGPLKIALDKNKNIFVGGIGGITELTASSNYATATNLYNVHNADGIAVDGSGNVFFSNYDDAQSVMELTAASGYASVVTLSEFNVPNGIAADVNGNIIVTDTNSSALREIVLH